MIESNFTYDGKSCDDFELCVVRFGSYPGGRQGESYSLNVQTEYARRNNDFKIVSTNFESPISFDVEFCRKDGEEITQEQQRQVKKWLFQRQMKWMQIQDEEHDNIEYKVIFNAYEDIKYGTRLLGMCFKGICNTHYGFTPIIEQTYNISSGDSINITVNTDHQKDIYPELVITMNNDGRIEITNSVDESNNVFYIDGTTNGEVITVDNELPLISSSLDNTINSVYDRFSKYWLYLTDGLNVLTVSNDCAITIRYRETRMVGI